MPRYHRADVRNVSQVSFQVGYDGATSRSPTNSTMGRPVQRRICKEHGSRRGHSCERAQGLRLGLVRRDDALDGLDLGWPVPLLFVCAEGSATGMADGRQTRPRNRIEDASDSHLGGVASDYVPVLGEGRRPGHRERTRAEVPIDRGSMPRSRDHHELGRASVSTPVRLCRPRDREVRAGHEPEPFVVSASEVSGDPKVAD